MPKRLVWHRLAVADRERIYRYIEADGPRAAIDIDARFDDAIARPADFPDRGRAGRVPGTREIVVPRTPYTIPYRVQTIGCNFSGCCTVRNCGPISSGADA